MTRRPDPDLGDPPPRRGCWPLLILPICVALTLAAGALYGAVS